MKAINSNQKLQLKKAMEVCARGQRAKEVLNITAGSQSISPFYWAIATRLSLLEREVIAQDSGALVCAQTILEDLLTIRADRDAAWNNMNNEIKAMIRTTRSTTMALMSSSLAIRSASRRSAHVRRP